MTHRWITTLLGLTLIQAILSLSPIPVPDEEWEEFSRMLRDPSYRLPTTTRPSHYEVTLRPYFDVVPVGVQPFTFDGEVTINISPTEEGVSEIVMHCNDLTLLNVTVDYEVNGTSEDITGINEDGYTCEMPYSFLRINTSVPLQMNQEYVVRITFRGNLQDNMRGFYRSWYNDSNGRKWMATTQFQPGHARQAFPCYDEPVFKATFDITIIRLATYQPSISNMPIRLNETFGDGWVSETFHTTPLTSTYLLAFIVSHYIVVASNNDTERPFDIYSRDNAGSTGQWSLEIGELLLDAMEAYTDFPYYNVTANMNMKQASIPDFSAGAMENWGLLTYREALILYDPLNSNHFYRQRVANIVSHEIAHMWFGNLVTCAWWDNLWLNEGFARFYQYYLTGSVAPELGYETRFIVEQLQTVMLSDSLDSAHPLTDPGVNNPTQVTAHFSTITYAKGAAVLRMTQHLLGNDTFVKGLRRYLRNRQFDVAEPEHLFSALDEAAIEDQALAAYDRVTINDYFRSWSEQSGHPLLTVSINQETGRMTVTQERWERTTGVSQFPSLWKIPVTWTRGGDIDFENLKPSQVLSAQVTTIDRGTTEPEWVIFNKQVSGFYRVNYDWTNWALITRELRSDNRTAIHEYNRAQIVDDLFQLARASVISYARAFNILSFLEFEDAYAPWISAINSFNFLRRRLAHNSDSLLKLDEEIIRLSTAVVNRLGFSEIDGESYMDGLLRMYVMEFLCNVGHEGCVAAGIENFQRFRNGGFIPANIRPWAYCVGLREGTADNFNYFWNQYLNEDLANEIVVMLQTAGCTSDQQSLERFLDGIISSNDTVRPQDFSTAINSALTGNEYNTQRVFTWLRNNLEQTINRLGSAATPISGIAARLLNEADILQFESWLESNREVLGTAYNTGISGANSARQNIQWYQQRIAELELYFETGYVEDVIGGGDGDNEGTEDGDENTDGDGDGNTDGDGDENTDGDGDENTDGDGDPVEEDAANIAALSILTLVVTVAINLLI